MMPVHDWTQVDAGLFHDFHQGWTVALRTALNAGGLPPDYFALVEQNVRGPIPHLLTLKRIPGGETSENGGVALAVAEAPPKTHLVERNETSLYSARSNQITVRHRHGEVVAVIEIVSPGNKASRAEMRSFLEKSSGLLRQGVHLLVIDLFPPGPRDPQGIHREIWKEFSDGGADLPADKPLTLASYDAGPPCVAYVEPIAVGEALPGMPLFLRPEFYVPTPLEATYMTAWSGFPGPLKGLLESGERSP